MAPERSDRILSTRSLVVFGLLSLALPSAAQEPPSTAQATKPVGDAHRGEILAKRWCVSCHLQDNSVSGPDAAPTFHSVAEKVGKDPDAIRGFLKHPHKPMPPLELDRAQIEDLIAYFKDMAKP